ncbi:MAG TPA: hypothetical protein ENI06_02740 [Spirochaetales bacterium]|nr:hypothetical protein [Spirochaetales bacterium]
MKNNINIGVLGLGRMGQVHCRQITATPGLSLSAAIFQAARLMDAVRESDSRGQSIDLTVDWLTSTPVN